MKRNTFLVAAVLAAFLTAPVASSACSALGPSAHVGPVLAIDAEAKTFTVLDAQTNTPVTFLADDALLAELENVEGRVVVDFEADGVDLRAIGIRY